jgi:excisionase family DNA binding protein
MKRSRLPIRPQRASRGWRGRGLAESEPEPVPGGLEDADRPLLLDSRAVAELLDLGRTKVFQMMTTGELPVIRIGRCVRVPRSGLESWIATRTEMSVERDDRRPSVRWGATSS